MKERKVIDYLEQLLGIVTAPPAREALRDLRVLPRALVASPAPAGLPRLQAFIEKRLPEALPAS